MAIDVGIFNSERAVAGLENLLRRPAFAFAAQLVPAKTGGFRAVLATAGWSKQDDVFLPCELIAVETVGQLKSCQAIGNDGKALAYTVVEKLPPGFQVVASVSEGTTLGIECRFRKFDYAIGSKDSFRIVERNRETAHLTKHLKAYGGNGRFQGQQIGRVLRGISFSTQGLVGPTVIPIDEPSRIAQDFAACFGDSETTPELTQLTSLQRDVLRFFDRLTDEE